MTLLSSEHQRIAEANRRYYQRMASLYFQTETCVTNKRDQNTLRELLNFAIARSAHESGSLRILDACGGAGNAALKLQAAGFDVTICDISLELLRLYRDQAHGMGYPVKAVCGEIGAFLETCRDYFDMIVFSSALHHLVDIDAVLLAAARALRPGGVIVTVFDPTPRSDPRLRLALSLDYLLFKLIRQPSDVVAGLGRRLRRFISGRAVQDKQHIQIDSDTLGVLAEYHVEHGIDDHALVMRLRAAGLTVLYHDRGYAARYPLTSWLLERIALPVNFSLVVQRPREWLV